jgi:uncharacterized protein (DUF2249 family)
MNTIDARNFEPHALAHGAILGALAVLPEGVTLTVLSPVVPVPLFAEIEAQYPGRFIHEVTDETAGDVHTIFKLK